MKIVRKLLLTFLGISIAGMLVFLGVVISEAPKLDEDSTRPDGFLTTVLNDDEEVILTLAGAEANRIYVDLALIPDDLEHAFIAIEDARFYTHHGIDPIGIARAFVKGITSGHLSQGASTITQQLLKNNAFSGWTDESMMDKVVRKIQEQYLAIRLETIKDKDWILENYLNTINLGGGSWGVEAASRRYFNKDVSELTLAECAVIAGITKSPEGYNPIRNPEKSRERQLLVLKCMYEQDYIDETAYNEALEEEVYQEIADNHQDRSAQIFSYYEDALLNAVVADLQEEYDYSEEKAWDLVYRGGLTIYGTVDSEIQEACEKVSCGDYFADEKVQTSIVVLSVLDGSVKGIIGGRGKKDASLVYNRALESIRQPGSTIKVIGEYAAALESGMATLGTVCQDKPVTYSDGTSIDNAYGEYRGATTIHNAIVTSSNTVAYEVFKEVGMEKTIDSLGRFGIDTLTEADEVEALSLGGTNGGVTNLEMTAAYNAIAAGGCYTRPYFYTRVVDHDGKELLSIKKESRPAVSRETAAALTWAMEDVLRRGTGVSAAFETYPQAGKTGTTNQSRDLWMVGFSPYFACGIWGGYDDNEAQSSTRYVKSMWGDLMQEIHYNYKYREFDLTGMDTALICTKCGNLAVEGLCDQTLAGDMTQIEYYAPGSRPDAYCSCHERVKICTKSGKRAGSYCPDDAVTEKVYLNYAEAQTTDEACLLPAEAQEICDIHTSFWDTIFPQREEDKEQGFFFWDWFHR